MIGSKNNSLFFKPATVSKPLFNTRSGSATTAAHSSIGASFFAKSGSTSHHNRPSQGETKIVSSSASSASSRHNKYPTTGFQSRFFRDQQEEAERRVQSTVREIEELVAMDGGDRRGQSTTSPSAASPRWWYFHGPLMGWRDFPAPVQHQQQNYSSNQQQRSSSSSSYQQQQRNPNQYQQQQQQSSSGSHHQRDNSSSGLMMRLVFPWFVFFLVIGEMADYFSTEFIVAAASSTVPKGMKSIADKVHDEAGSSSGSGGKK